MTEHIDVVYGFIANHIKLEDACDVVQETMLGVWKSMDSYDNKASFTTWIIGIAKRKIADFYRTAYKHLTYDLSDYENIISDNQEEKIIDKLDLQFAEKALNANEKRLVYCIFDAGMTYSEAAEILEIPVGTVKSRMSSIKEKLRKKLQTEVII